MKITDYVFCETCQTYVDFWKYGHDIEDAGHSHCNWRYVTEEELLTCVEDCIEEGCFEEDI